MKKVIILSSILLSAFLIKAQTVASFSSIKVKEVPKEVVQSFTQMSDGASASSWGVYKDRFQATFKEDEHLKFYHFNDKGLYVETLTQKDWKEAPKQLKEGKSRIQQKYWDVKEYYERETDDGDISYILVLENDKGQLKTVYFDDEGTYDKKSFSGY